MKRALLCLLGLLGLLLAGPAAAYVLTLYAPGTYNANVATMNANLGISNALAFEDFEDEVLIPQLSVSVHNPNNEATALTYGSTAWPNAAWTTPQSLLWNYTPLGGQAITFTIAGGTDRFGVGLGEDDLPGGGLYINSLDVAGIGYYALPGYVQGGQIRNGYLVIEREAGDPLLTSVSFSGSAGQELLTFDHVAIGAAPTGAPAPVSIALLALGLAMLRLARGATQPNASSAGGSVPRRR